MKQIGIAIAGAAALLCGCAMDERPAAQAAEAQRAEAMLADELRGRTPGTPQQCVQLTALRGNRGIGQDVILFQGVGGRVYVNRPAGGCRLRTGEALVTRSPSGRLCRGDIAQIVDLPTGPMGSCTLGEFVPYERAR